MTLVLAFRYLAWRTCLHEAYVYCWVVGYAYHPSKQTIVDHSIIFSFLHVPGLVTNIQGIFLSQESNSNIVMLPVFEDRWGSRVLNAASPGSHPWFPYFQLTTLFCLLPKLRVFPLLFSFINLPCRSCLMIASLLDGKAFRVRNWVLFTFALLCRTQNMHLIIIC